MSFGPLPLNPHVDRQSTKPMALETGASVHAAPRRGFIAPAAADDDKKAAGLIAEDESAACWRRY